MRFVLEKMIYSSRSSDIEMKCQGLCLTTCYESFPPIEIDPEKESEILKQ